MNGLLKSLGSNLDIPSHRRVVVPNPQNYHVILRETLKKPHRNSSDDVRDILLYILPEGDPDEISSVVISNAFYFGNQIEAITNN